MGKMVCDARHAIEAATELSKSPRPICLYGFAMGGTVAILTAAMDDRVQGVAAIGGFIPLRTDTPDRRTGGIARLGHLYGWPPKLGAFIGHEDRIPVD
jgi:dienelactone hydrolase